MPHPNERNVAANIRYLRTARGLTQDALAAALADSGHDLTSMAICNLERGRRRITVEDLAALADVLGETPQRLLTADLATSGANGPAQDYTVTLEAGVTEAVTADRTDVVDDWLAFYLRGVRVFYAPVARILCIRGGGA